MLPPITKEDSLSSLAWVLPADTRSGVRLGHSGLLLAPSTASRREARVHTACTWGLPQAPSRAPPAQPSMSPQDARPQPGTAVATSCFPWEQPLAGRGHGFGERAPTLGD